MSAPHEPGSSAASADSQRRAVRIRRVIEQAMSRRAAGETLSDDEIASSHADLLPELRDELSLLSMMERARRTAHASSADVDIGVRSPDASDVKRLLDVRGFTIEKELHRGGQGVVYEAVQRSTGRGVAIKLLHDLDATDPRVAARFEREARVLAMIDHPNVVKVIDTGAIAGRRYIAMDLIRGVPWTEFERGAASDVRASLQRFVAICQAVGAAHLRGVIHRDLKPGNILVDAAGTPHVLDFGLAKLTDAGNSSAMTMTREGQFVGSLPWASPEQAAGGAELLDVRSDVYSLGVVLYQILTGAFPYNVQGPWREVAQAIADTPPARPRTHRRDLDLDLERILLKCLTKEPEQRYQSARDVAEDVRRYLNGEPVAARGGGTAYILRRLARKHRFAVAAAGCFLLLLVGAAVTTTTLYQKERRALSGVEEARQQAQDEADKAKAVVAFLQDMMSAADPGREGKDIRVADLLDRASLVLQDQKTLKGKPLVEAAVRQTMGETYCGLGMADAGIHEFQKALELQRSAGAGDSDDAIQTMHSLATSLWMMGRYPEAQQVVEEAMAARGITSSTPLEDEDTAELINIYNFILTARGDYTHIIENAQRRLDFYVKEYGRADWRTVYAISDLSTAYGQTGNFQRAAELCEEALELARAAKGPDDPLTLSVATNLAHALRELGRHKEAEPLVREVLESRRRTLPEGHPQIGKSLVQWAHVCGAKGDVAGAREAMREALEIQIKALGPHHLEVANSQQALSSILIHEKEFAEAAELLQAAFESLEPSWCEHPGLGRSIAEDLVLCYRQSGAEAKAAEIEARLLELDCGDESTQPAADRDEPSIEGGM